MYDTPVGRKPIATTSIDAERTYERIRTVKGGGLNLGIYVVRLRSNHQKKFVEKTIDATNRILLRELYFLRHLKHPYILDYIDGFVTRNPKEAAVYTDYANYGSLYDLVEKYLGHNPRRTIPELFVWHVLESVASALQYIHHGINASSTFHDTRSTFHDTRSRVIGAGVSEEDFLGMWEEKQWPLIQHRDIKLQNILLRYGERRRKVTETRNFPLCFSTHEVMRVTRPMFPTVLLADFGIAASSRDADCHEIDTEVGTAHWLPPELPECSARGDVWALGAVTWSLCALKLYGPLFPLSPDKRSPEIVDKYLWSKEARIGLEDKARCGEPYSSHLDNIVYNCMRHDKKDRPYSYKLVEDIKIGKAWADREGKLVKRPLPDWVFHKT